MSALNSTFRIGIAQRIITPPPGVELAGLGYYLNRTWQRIRDELTATSLVVSDQCQTLALVAVDLLYNEQSFWHTIQQRISAQTGIPHAAICGNFSHTHNAPTAGLILGAGDSNPKYLEFVANQIVSAVLEAIQRRQPARLFVGKGDLTGMTFNRARENGPVDTRVSVLRADTLEGRPLAVVINFHSLCIAHMETDLWAVGRDWPGELVDEIEAALPGATALYLQGTCGDVNFRREFNGTQRRFEPAQALTKVTLQALESARPVAPTGVATACRLATLPTRRWARQELLSEREEGLYRLKSGDANGWLEGIGRVCVNQPERLALRYGGNLRKAVAAVARFAIEWTTKMLDDFDQRPDGQPSPVHAWRIGDIYFVTNPAELFTSLGLQLRRNWPHNDLFMLGYTNGSIGYLPDAEEIEKRSYAAIQSPKFTLQFPFTSESGGAMVQEMLSALEQVAKGACI